MAGLSSHLDDSHLKLVSRLSFDLPRGATVSLRWVSIHVMTYLSLLFRSFDFSSFFPNLFL